MAFVTAIKMGGGGGGGGGETRKFSSLWRGPYTDINKVGPVNYHVQLILWVAPKSMFITTNCLRA